MFKPKNLNVMQLHRQVEKFLAAPHFCFRKVNFARLAGAGGRA
jgi:hypothetical protein